METLLTAKSTVAASGMPSPLKSAAIIDWEPGKMPRGCVTGPLSMDPQPLVVRVIGRNCRKGSLLPLSKTKKGVCPTNARDNTVGEPSTAYASYDRVLQVRLGGAASIPDNEISAMRATRSIAPASRILMRG